jgi:ATPase subunit of ABC transporter with duplicated ATPase domains
MAGCAGGGSGPPLDDGPPVASREALEESLDDFPGSIVFVSHDRAFIDRLATRVIDLREGRPMLLPGNYTETADARTERRRRPEPTPARRADSAAPTQPPAAAAVAVLQKPAPRAARPADAADDKEAARRRRRIKTLEEKIAALETEIESLETRLWEEALTLGPVAAHELSKQKIARKDELDLLVEEWAKLSEESDQPASRPS